MHELFPFQQTGAEWLAGRRLALLADECGLGKSGQAVRAADIVNANRILVLCPASVRVNWIREFAKFSQRALSMTPLLTSELTLSALSADGLTCSYDLLQNSEIATLLLATAWDLLILDEAHYLKSPNSDRTGAVLAAGGLIHRASRTWALTGTPTPNHAGELYPLFRCFGIATGSYEQWREKFCTTRHTPFGLKITGSQNIPELRQLMAPWILRRKKVDVMKDLPKIAITSVDVEPGPVDEELYFMNERDQGILQSSLASEERVLSAFLAQHSATEAIVGMLNATTLQARPPTTYRRYVGLQKVPPVAAIISDELESKAYEKIVIFAVHKDVIHELQRALKKFKPVTVWGGTPAHTRQRNIDKFRRDKECRVFLGNIQAAGVGIDGLQEVCHHGAFVEQDWVPGNNAQAAMRLHRIGQQFPVSFRVFRIADSSDERVQRALARKTKEILAMFDEL